MSNTKLSESINLVEEDLRKLSCKDLKSLIKQIGVRATSNSKKIDLVKVLLDSNPANVSFVDKNDIKTNSSRPIGGRMTRSRASMFTPLVDIQDGLLDTSQLQSTNIGTTDKKEKNFKEKVPSSIKGTTENKIKSEVETDIQNNSFSMTSEMFEIVSSVNKSTRPLMEITNSDVLSKNESEQTNCSETKKTSRRKNRKNLVKSLSTENLNAGNGLVSEMPSFESTLDANKTDKVNCSSEVNCDNKKSIKKIKGKGRRAKVADEIAIQTQVINKSVVEDLSTNSQAENRNGESAKVFEMQFSNSNVDKVKECTTTSCEEKRPPKKTRTRGKKESEYNIETSENLSNAVNELSIYNQTEESLKQVKSPIEEKRRKLYHKKSHELDESSQKSDNRRKQLINEKCDSKKQITLKDSKEGTSASHVNQDGSDEADSSEILKFCNEFLFNEESDSALSDKNDCSPNSSNKNKTFESDFKNIEVGVDSSQHANFTESKEENKTFTGVSTKTTNSPKMSPFQPPSRSSTFVVEEGVSTTTTNSPKTSPFQPPLRSSTFVLEEGVSTKTTNSPKTSPFQPPSRSSTFVVEEGISTKTTNSPKMSPFQPPSRNSTFVVEEALPITPNEVKPSSKQEKSIGKRILSLSVKQGHVKLPTKQTSGSTLKKSISKHNTQGSAYKNKFGVATKLPNFKSIHQRLFQNMESIGENKQRAKERAEALIRSPAPRCALLSPKIVTNKDPSSSKKLTTSSFHQVVRNCAKTPVTASRPAPGSPSLNRFGFKNPVKRIDRSAVKKKPNMDLTKIKDQERQIVRGVRSNKRFLLQMKMREGKQ